MANSPRYFTEETVRHGSTQIHCKRLRAQQRPYRQTTCSLALTTEAPQECVSLLAFVLGGIVDSKGVLKGTVEEPELRTGQEEGRPPHPLSTINLCCHPTWSPTLSKCGNEHDTHLLAWSTQGELTEKSQAPKAPRGPHIHQGSLPPGKPQYKII